MLVWEDLLEKGMATHSSNLVWRITRQEEPGRLQSKGLQRVGHDGLTPPPPVKCTLIRAGTSSWPQGTMRCTVDQNVVTANDQGAEYPSGGESFSQLG